MMIHTMDPNVRFFCILVESLDEQILFMYIQNKLIPLEKCHILMWRSPFFISKINEYKSCQQAFKLLKTKCEWSNSTAKMSLKKKKQNWNHKTLMCSIGLVGGWWHSQEFIDQWMCWYFNSKYYWNYGKFPLIFLSPRI